MQKMRMLLALFITLPLILSLSIVPENAKPKKINNVMGEILDKLKSFNSKTEEEKDKILKELDSSISDLNKEIKKYISEKKEYPNDKIIDLMEKILEMNHYMRNRVCKQGDENCSNEKKRLMNNLLDVVEDNFGKCEVTIEHVIKLTSNTHSNLIQFTLVIQAIVDNKDLIEKSKTEIIINLINCLSNRIDDYMKLIEKQYTYNSRIVKYLRKNNIEALQEALLKLNSFDGKEEAKLSFEKREDIYEEILDILKEIKDSNNNKTLIIIISCLATITILIGGFLLYRFIRRKNSNLIENTTDLVTSENKVSK